MFIHKYTIFTLEGIYLKKHQQQNKEANKTKTKKKKEKEKKKERVLSRIRNLATCQKLYEDKVNVLQTIFKRLYSYLQREIFPSEDSVFSSVMIRDVGEDPLSPALRDIERERERGGGGQNCTRHTVVTPSLFGMLV